MKISNSVLLGEEKFSFSSLSAKEFQDFLCFYTKVTISGNLSSREIVFVTLDIFHSILMLTFEFLHFETLLKIKLKFDVNQLLFSASQDFDVWNRSARAAPAGGPALLSCGVLLLSRDLCTGCCTINGHCIACQNCRNIKKNPIFNSL